jgi:uncharacterized damage-inducible protein DinB
MSTLQLMFQHHAWANRRVLAVLANLDTTLLTEDAKGAFGSIDQTITHMAGVEDMYLALMKGQDLSSFGSQETYFGHDTAWFRQRLETLGAAYAAFLASIDDASLDNALIIPWINAPLTIREGLIQVLTHSAQHRAQILSILGDRGQKVPDMDYVVMRLEGQGTPDAGQTGKV